MPEPCLNPAHIQPDGSHAATWDECPVCGDSLIAPDEDDLAQVIFDSDAQVSWFDSLLIAKAVMPLIEVERRAARELSMALASTRAELQDARARIARQQQDIDDLAVSLEVEQP